MSFSVVDIDVYFMLCSFLDLQSFIDTFQILPPSR